MAKYQKAEGGGVIRLSDGASIPADPDNRDYREMLAYVEAGGELEPAPVPGEPELSPEELALQEARREAKAALVAALPDGAVTQEQVDLLFGTTTTSAPDQGAV